MKEYIDKNKQNTITFSELQQLENDGIIEEYDLFSISSEHFKSMRMFYSDGIFYLINGRKDRFMEIDRDLLRDRRFEYRNNYVKEYIERYGKDNFNLLTSLELIRAVLGRDFDDRDEER